MVNEVGKTGIATEDGAAATTVALQQPDVYNARRDFLK
jgi:hypothetical protein